MLALDQPLNLPTEFLSVILLVCLKFYKNGKEEDLIPLITFPRSENSPFWESVALQDVDKRIKIETLMLKHCKALVEFSALRALPFLPDDSYADFVRLESEIKNFWTAIRSSMRDFFSEYGFELTTGSCEEIDSNLITFAEWAIDVRFLNATESERAIIIKEFPFAKLSRENS